jgi:hypothetical protein
MRNLLCFSVSTAVLASLTSAQMVQVLPSDLATKDRFGESVSIDSGFLLVGSKGDDDNGSGSGSAYLFEVPTDSGPAGYELVKFTANNGKAFDSFGESVALQDGIALIGAKGKDALGNNAGCAYLFDADPSSSTFGAQMAWLLPSGDNLDWIGCSVALDSDLALVGAQGADVGAISPGAAFLFDADPSSPTFGQELVKLTASDGGDGHNLGCSVSIAGGLALLGAEDATTTGGSTGAAYLFDVNPSSPTFGAQLTKFVARNGAPGDKFGWSVSLSDGRALVGAPFRDLPWFLYTKFDGAAYLFDADPSSTTFGVVLTEFLPTHTRPHALELGRSVSLDGRFAALGAPRSDFRTSTGWRHWKAGAAQIFNADPSSPVFSKSHSKLHALKPGDFEYFGHSICIQNGVLAVGTPLDNTGPGKVSGSVHVTRLVDQR